MDLYIDNASPAVSTFISDVTPQVIRKAYVEYSSLFKKFLETDPLFSVERGNKMSIEAEHAIIGALNDNLKKTYFRDRCLNWNIDQIVRYGTSGTYSFAVNDYNANSLMTVKAEDGYEGSYKQEYQAGEGAIISTAVHPLNVIMDPRASYMIAPDFMGFVGDICVSSLKTLLENPEYNTDILKEIFEACKTGLPSEHWYSGTHNDARDYSKGHSSIIYLWTRLPFEGNEADPTWYAIEIINGKVIRIDENPLDDNTIPLSLMRILPRPYTWYGNTPLEDKIAIQNMQYWLINTTIESTARLMDRIILYREGSLDVEAINSRHQTGGMVPYKGQEQDLSRLMYAPQFPNVAFRENDWLMNLMRREDQDSSAMPNFNPQSEGGPTNKTLGGAQMMASIGEMKMALYVEQFCSGLKDVAKHQLMLMRNIATGNRDDLLGKVSFSCRVSNVFNYVRESLDSQNRLSQIINFKATKLPQFATVKTGQFVIDFIRNSVKREDIEDYCDIKAIKELDEKEMAQVMAPPAPPKAAIPTGMPPTNAGNGGMPQQMPMLPPPEVMGGANV